MSLRQVALVLLPVALLGVAALLLFVLWIGRGILESPRAGSAAHSEWLTVANDMFEFRGTVYKTAEALSAALPQLQPKPQLVTIRWVATAGASSSSVMQAAQVQQAREALLQAHITPSSAEVGNEIFIAGPSSASGTR